MNSLQKELFELIKMDTALFDLIKDKALDDLWLRDFENTENGWMSPTFWLALGYSPDEWSAKAMDWQYFIHPDDLKSATDNMNKHIENPDHPYEQVIRFSHKNGSTVWIHSRGWAMRNAQGKVIRMVGIHKDITAEKEKLNTGTGPGGKAMRSLTLQQAENSFWDNPDAYRMLFDSIDEGYCIIEMIFDPGNKPVDYRFLAINASFERQTGLQDAVGKTMRTLAPEHEEHWFEIYGKIALTGESLRFENRAEQLHRWYDVFAFRFGDPENNHVAILFNDITERKIAEMTIQQLNQDLTFNLQEVESINKELESFSYMVSHDLRAPLRAINGHTSILLEDFSEDLTTEVKNSIFAINKNAQKMGRLIDNLLNLSGIGRKEVLKIRVDMEEIVKEIIDELCEQHYIDNLIFKIGDLIPTLGDATLIKQIWLNLLTNAFKYSQLHPSPLIHIGSIQENQETIYYVRDNGVGFDMKFYNKLFGVFQRLHSEYEFEGTGIGLAIVERIVTLHGGRVWAESKVNEGASFYFTLPAPNQN